VGGADRNRAKMKDGPTMSMTARQLEASTFTMFNKTQGVIELPSGRGSPASSGPHGRSWPARISGERRLLGHHHPAGPKRLGLLFISGPRPAQRLSKSQTTLKLRCTKFQKRSQQVLCHQQIVRQMGQNKANGKPSAGDSEPRRLNLPDGASPKIVSSQSSQWRSTVVVAKA
jgi:hypothetical protein